MLFQLPKPRSWVERYSCTASIRLEGFAYLQYAAKVERYSIAWCWIDLELGIELILKQFLDATRKGRVDLIREALNDGVDTEHVDEVRSVLCLW